MNSMRTPTMALACVLSLGSIVAAPIVYVDKSADAQQADGTAERPFASIQQGVDAVDAAGTVYVLPGIYDIGETADADGCLNRVLIQKKVSLVAKSFEETACRTNTVIRGRAATSPRSAVKYGLGDDAVRCLRVTASGVTVRGFTLENGHTRFDPNAGATAPGGSVNQNFGGAVFGVAADTRIEDCVIRGCVARSGGATANCRLVRCLVTDCSSSNVGVCFRSTEVYNSIIVRNGLLGGSGIGAYSGNIYNSILAENATGLWQDSGANCYNCAIFKTPFGTLATKKGFYGCVTDNDFGDWPHDEKCQTASYESCFASPLANDFRVVRGSALDGRGDVANAATAVGGEFDFFGQQRLTNESAMNVGAVEATVAVGSDDVVFAPKFAAGFAGATWANGEFQNVLGPVVVGTQDSFLREKSGAVTYPSSFRLQLPTDRATAYLVASVSDGSETFPVLLNGNDTVDLPRLPKKTTDAVYGLSTSANVLFVDREAGSDTTGDGTEAKPYQSLQRAATAVGEIAEGGCVVKVMPGTYDNETGVPATGYGSLPCRLSVSAKTDVRFVAVGGPSVTKVCGKAGTDEGASPVRCVFANPASAKGIYFSGFAFSGGRTGESGEDARGGAVFRSDSAGACWLSDCVIEDCESADALVFRANAVRCQFRNSLTAGGVLIARGNLISSLAWGCGPRTGTKANYLIDSSATAYNVSIGSSYEKAAMSLGAAYNCVFDLRQAQNDINGYGINNNGIHKYTLARDVGGTPQTEAGGNQEGSVFGVSAGFADAERGDLRLIVCSAARGLAKFDAMWKGCPTDVFGNPFAGDADGRFTAGAVESTVPGAAFTSSYPNGIEPTDPQPFDSEGKIDIASTAQGRPLLGFSVNGELIATTNRNWTLRASDYPGVENFSVKAVYGTNFWADAVNGNESNSGLYECEPKKYIRSALALTEAGDVVVALPGVYDAEEEAQAHAAGATIRSRVVVPSGRTVRSRDGADVTRIVGAPSPNPTRLSRLGPEAIRCVYLHENSSIAGFTLTDGNTDSPATGSADSGDDMRGGGVLSANRLTCEVRDCVITNCASLRGGGVALVTCRRCRIVGNIGAHMGTGAYLSRLFRCFADQNDGNRMWFYQGSLEGCTVGAHNRWSGTTPAETWIETVGIDYYIHNTIVLAGAVYCASSNVYDCVFAPGVKVDGLAKAHQCLLDATPLVFEADGVTPKIGENVAVDRGHADWMSMEDLNTDLLGSPHYWNGCVDVGAVEADWRSRYARVLSGAKMKVDDAPASATEELDRQIRLRDGSLEMSWRASREPRRLAVNCSVPGTGTLVVRKNGDILDTVTAGETKQVVYDNPAVDDRLTFEYESGEADTLGALIGKMASLSGMTVVIR